MLLQDVSAAAREVWVPQLQLPSELDTKVYHSYLYEMMKSKTSQGHYFLTNFYQRCRWKDPAYKSNLELI